MRRRLRPEGYRGATLRASPGRRRPRLPAPDRAASVGGKGLPRVPQPQDPAPPDAGRFPALSPIGVDGLLALFGDRLTEAANRAALAFRAAADAAGLPGVAETATSPAAVYLRFDPGLTDAAALGQAVGALLASRDWFAAPLPAGRRRWHVPAAFGADAGPQLDEAAALAGMTREAAIASVCAAPLRVQAIGFAPGLPYLGELPPVWDLPRLAALTPRVPEGAITLAIRQIVLFPVPSPTGWRHIGTTALRLFLPEAAEPFLLRAGDEVLFRPVAADRIEALRRGAAPDGGAVAEPLA